LQLKRNADTDDSGAENDDVEFSIHPPIASGPP
jgi:hypothetical protein